MSRKPKILMPTDEEDVAINLGIAADPDTFEVSAEQMRAMKPLGRRGRGQPKLRSTKEQVGIDRTEGGAGKPASWQPPRAYARDRIMDAPQSIQIIYDAQGHPAFVVIPYATYMAKRNRDKDLVPDEVARRLLVDGLSPVRAWREHLNLTQMEMAKRLGISQAAYAEQENSTGKLRKAMREKLAAALGITPAQLDLVG